MASWLWHLVKPRYYYRCWHMRQIINLQYIGLSPIDAVWALRELSRKCK